MTAPEDVTAAIERLRAYESGKSRPYEYDHEQKYDDLRTLLAEVERLRSEREALHSDETREAVARAVFVNQSDDKAYLKRHLAELWDSDTVPGDYDGKQSIERAYRYADAVLSVLTADPEAGQ